MKFAALEKTFEDELVASMADVDRCLTKAYDRKLAGEDVAPIFDACRMAQLHQFILDCGATFTDELYKLTRLSFSPVLQRQGGAQAARRNQHQGQLHAAARAAAGTCGDGTAHRHAAGAGHADSTDSNGSYAPRPGANALTLGEQLAHAGAHVFERKRLRQHRHLRAFQ